MINPTRRAPAFSHLLVPNPDAFPYCPIPGCTRPSAAYAGKGLSQIHCRYHCQRRNRHGDLVKGTYRANELVRYRRAAERYLKAHAEDVWVANAFMGLRALMDGAGPDERVVDTLRMPPSKKARAAFARMRSAEVPPMRLLTIYLAVSCAVEEDPLRPIGVYDEYRLTQIAKAALRTASGYHSYYAPGYQYDRYPRSSGLALRHMGRMLEEVCQHVKEAHLAAVLALKVECYGARKERSPW